MLKYAEGRVFIEVCWGYNQQGLCVPLRASLGSEWGQALWNPELLREASGFGILMQAGQASVATVSLRFY